VPVYPSFKTPTIPTFIWVALYVFLANGLMVYAFSKTKQTAASQQKLMTCIIVMPGTFMALLNNYLLSSIKSKRLRFPRNGAFTF